MPFEAQVGFSALSINHGSTFMVTDLSGEIAAESEHGVFAADTRFVSHYAIFANGRPWERLTSAVTAYHSARIHLTNRAFATESGDLPAGTLSLVIRRDVEHGVQEALAVTNYSQRPVRFNLEIAIRSDFADLFEVRRHQFVHRGRIETLWDAERAELCTRYTNGDFRRACIYRLLHSDSHPHYANGRITFEIELAPAATWTACSSFILSKDSAPSEGRQHEGRQHTPPDPCVCDEEERPLARLERIWQSSATKLTTANEDVYRLYRQSIEDMGALRLYDQDFAPDVWIPAAGVPWYVTVFGRDSLIVSLQNMIVHAGFGVGALAKLAQLQATEMDDWRDAEPGKIAHEIRHGELAHLGRIPHTPYYGTADATPLYLIVLHETWKWRGDVALLRTHRDVALRCLEWIDRHGDLDGDGFQEYQTRSPQGYENMGWKDAFDAVVYPDGSLVRQPKALCELQGYVFDAWMRMAEVFDALAEPDRAADLRGKAAALQARVEAAFWCEDLDCYAFALDAEKRPVRTVASNAGHLLWSGIVRPDRAARLIARFQQPDMWSGWGIRTLSAANPAYNPNSYHTGSVWPHDNGIIALGCARYGVPEATARIARDISEAASHFAGYRLPELYAGFARQSGAFPVRYPQANVPQAWAAGTIFHLLQAILGLQADAPAGRLSVDPHLPHWLPDLTLRGLAVGPASLDLRFHREGDHSRWEILRLDGDLHVEQRPWTPW